MLQQKNICSVLVSGGGLIGHSMSCAAAADACKRIYTHVNACKKERETDHPTPPPL